MDFLHCIILIMFNLTSSFCLCHVTRLHPHMLRSVFPSTPIFVFPSNFIFFLWVVPNFIHTQIQRDKAVIVIMVVERESAKKEPILEALLFYRNRSLNKLIFILLLILSWPNLSLNELISFLSFFFNYFEASFCSHFLGEQ